MLKAFQVVLWGGVRVLGFLGFLVFFRVSRVFRVFHGLKHFKGAFKAFRVFRVKQNPTSCPKYPQGRLMAIPRTAEEAKP